MKILKAFLAFFLVTFFLYSNGFAQTCSTSADQIIGMYWSPSKDAKIEIYKRGGQYSGKSVWVANPRKDYNNPDATLKKGNTRN